MKDNIVFVTTVVGEFVGRVVDHDLRTTKLILKDVRRFVQQGEQHGFYPAANMLASDKAEITFDTSNVIMYGNVSSEVESAYIQNVSGIQLATGRVNR